jgi:predicted dehydrogenase
MEKMRIGIAGVGKISGIYLKNLTGMFSKRIAVSAVTDIVSERAAQAAQEYHLRHIGTVDEMVRDPGVDIILNLTQPQVHHEVAMKAVKGGKLVYN